MVREEGVWRRGAEAKLALIRSVSRTRISWDEAAADAAMLVVLEFADCLVFIFIGFGAMN